MTEKNKKTQQATPAQPVPIQINAQYIKDMSFENPNAPASFANLQTAPNITVNVNVEARKLSDVLYETALVVNGTATDSEGRKLFVAELTYAALSTLKDIPEDSIRPLLLIEIPRIIFPFARNILSDMTRDGGYPPLMLNPVDFVALYRNGLENEKKAAAAPVQGNA